MEEQEENKKVTLLDQLSIAVSSPKNYKQLVKLKTGRLVWFVVIISFLLAFIEFGIGAIFWVGKVGGLRNLITNKIPAFTYHDNKLDMEHDMQLEIGNATLYINTENASVDLDSMDSDGVYIAIGSENIVMGMVSDGKGYDYMETPLKYMFLPDGFNNSKLAVLTPVFYMYMVIMFIAVMVASAGRQLLLALIFSIAGNRLARILNTGLSYGKVFTICVYAQTLAVFIMSVNTALGYLLSSFVVWIIALVVSMVFMNKAIGSYVSGDIPPGDVF